MNTGHDGSLGTAHANSSRDMLSRLETMTLMGVELPLEAIRRQIASGVDILIHLGRMRDKSERFWKLRRYAVLRMEKSGCRLSIPGRRRRSGADGASPSPGKIETGRDRVMKKKTKEKCTGKNQYGEYHFSKKNCLWELRRA